MSDVTVSTRLQPFGTTIFSAISQKAAHHNAINLGQGFPDFDGPEDVKEAAVAAIREGRNQYARSQGIPELVEAIALHQSTHYGLHYDPYTEVNVFSGATEGLMAAMQGLLNPGDEVLFIEPVYDSYPACAALAGASVNYYTLEYPSFAIDEARLRACVTPNTRMILVNSPHNPTGKVFSRDELEIIARVAQEKDLLALTDEVYEHLVYDSATHQPLASFPGMRERTLSISSLGKTWSLTGWKIGWATGPQHLITAAQAAHQFITFASATPFQYGAAHALGTHQQPYLNELHQTYSKRREILFTALKEAGFGVQPPAGTYFMLADFSALFDGDDVAFAHHLIETVGVAAIPPSAFYPSRPDAGRHLIRFAFCKKTTTLLEAAERLITLRA
ncbi:MAG: aminotransferase class I/II-fold pyridoxal phosphate-dependent enzyme [Myxococcales bacterium]|nr:aminotransferase class I/II-fold pyridoxal phosphate-dependent enzyme [Myxococcales bacterium]